MPCPKPAHLELWQKQRQLLFPKGRCHQHLFQRGFGFSRGTIDLPLFQQTGDRQQHHLELGLKERTWWYCKMW